MGFAVVDVNMRGTGCSGGAFDFFEPLQSLDGYDVIETIARQPWVQRPQGRDDGHLLRRRSASCSPRSSTRRASRRSHRCRCSTPPRRRSTRAASSTPASRSRGRRSASTRRCPPGPNGGQPWAYQQIQSGDTTCAANQVLHGEAADLNAKIAANSHYDAGGRRPARPGHVRATRSTCRCSWRASGRTSRPAATAPSSSAHFTGTTQKWFTFTNGAHIDSLDPDTYNRWYDFLQLFVAHQAPIENAAITTRRRAGHLPAGDGPAADRRRHAAGRPDPADPDVRRRARRVRGAAVGPGAVRQRRRHGTARRPRAPGDPYAGFEQSFSSLPDPGHHRAHLVPRPGRHARPTRRRPRAGVNSFTADAHALPLTDFGDQHRHRRAVGQRVAVAVELEAEPGGHRGLVRLRAAHARTRRSSAAARSTCG